MKRRDFLKKGALAAAGAGISVIVNADLNVRSGAARKRRDSEHVLELQFVRLERKMHTCLPVDIDTTE